MIVDVLLVSDKHRSSHIAVAVVAVAADGLGFRVSGLGFRVEGIKKKY